jgi:hypothetical protein
MGKLTVGRFIDITDSVCMVCIVMFTFIICSFFIWTEQLVLRNGEDYEDSRPQNSDVRQRESWSAPALHVHLMQPLLRSRSTETLVYGGALVELRLPTWGCRNAWSYGLFRR